MFLMPSRPSIVNVAWTPQKSSCITDSLGRIPEQPLRRPDVGQGLPACGCMTLRHTASTNLRRAGVDTMIAMKIVGHKSEQMHRRYNAIQPEDLHEAAAKLQSTWLTR
jgi:hypothetical protein